MLFNPDFRMIASTQHIDKDMGKIGNQLYENGGFSQEEFKLINRNQIHGKVKQSEWPVFTYSEAIENRIIVCNIDTHVDMGHLVIVEKYRKLDEIDLQLAYNLKLAINQQLKKDEFVRNNRGFHHEYFLQDVLDGRITMGKHYRENYEYVNSEFDGNLYCMVIEIARSSRVVNTMHLRALFETKFMDSMTLMYNGAVVIVFRFALNQQMNERQYL